MAEEGQQPKAPEAPKAAEEAGTEQQQQQQEQAPAEQQHARPVQRSSDPRGHGWWIDITNSGGPAAPPA